MKLSRSVPSSTQMVSRRALICHTYKESVEQSDSIAHQQIDVNELCNEVRRCPGISHESTSCWVRKDGSGMLQHHLLMNDWNSSQLLCKPSSARIRINSTNCIAVANTSSIILHDHVRSACSFQDHKYDGFLDIQ